MSIFKTTDDFFGSQGLFQLSSGVMPLPCHFRKVHFAVAMFAAESSVVSRTLEGKGLQAALPWWGKNIVTLGLIRYQDSDLGAYDEVIIAIPSVRIKGSAGWKNWLDLLHSTGKLRTGMHIIHIPVTTERSRMAGSECWGYPKTVLPIAHDFMDGKVHSSVTDGQGRLIMNCTGDVGPGFPMPTLQLLTYSFLEGNLLRTPVKIRGALRYHPFQNIRLKVGDSNHPMAADLRRLGLDGLKPVFYLDSDRFQAVFEAGDRV